MKYIITEEQSSRLKKLILSMFREDISPYEITKSTSIPLELILDARYGLVL